MVTPTHSLTRLFLPSLVCASRVSSRTSGPNAELGDGIQTLGKANAKLERSQQAAGSEAEEEGCMHLRWWTLIILARRVSSLLSCSVLAKIGTKADTADFRDRMHQEQTASTKQVKSLMLLLKSLQRDPSSTGSPVLQRLTTQFDREFRKFQSLNGEMDRKQVRVIDAVKSRTYSMAGGDEEDPLTARNQSAYDADAEFRRQQQQSQVQAAADLDIQFIEYDVEELEKRQREIGQIEQDVNEVADMYKDLQLLVHEQQEHIDLIDGAIYQTKEKTEAGMKELVEAEEYQKKSRKKKCCVLFMMLAIIAVIVILVELVK